MLNEVCLDNRIAQFFKLKQWTGLQSLRRYFELIVFQSYLQSTEPDTMRNVQAMETYVDNLPGKIAENDEHVQAYLLVSFPQ